MGLFRPRITTKDDFDFAIFNYPHLDGDVPRATSNDISQIIRFTWALSSVEDFHIRNRTITEKLLEQI